MGNGGLWSIFLGEKNAQLRKLLHKQANKHPPEAGYSDTCWGCREDGHADSEVVIPRIAAPQEHRTPATKQPTHVKTQNSTNFFSFSFFPFLHKLLLLLLVLLLLLTISPQQRQARLFLAPKKKKTHTHTHTHEHMRTETKKEKQNETQCQVWEMRKWVWKRTERKSREGDDDATAAAASAIIVLLLLLLPNCKLPFPDQTTKLQQTPTLCVGVCVCWVFYKPCLSREGYGV
jgi:hypothetical protein